MGIGKSYLAIELAERMIASEIKIICLDLTDQYEKLLSDFIDRNFMDSIDQKPKTAAKGRPVDQSKDDGGSIIEFIKTVNEVISDFLSPSCTKKILILNPANYRVSKQTSGAYNGNAAFSDLTPCEITAIISSASLKACQSLGMADQARVCLVYEEAHSLVPEWNSVVSDGDKNATAASARAILHAVFFGKASSCDDPVLIRLNDREQFITAFRSVN